MTLWTPVVLAFWVLGLEPGEGSVGSRTRFLFKYPPAVRVGRMQAWWESARKPDFGSALKPEPTLPSKSCA